MLQNPYFLAKIGGDTAEIELNFAEMLPIGRRVLRAGAGRAGRSGGPRPRSPVARWREGRGGRSSPRAPPCSGTNFARSSKRIIWLTFVSEVGKGYRKSNLILLAHVSSCIIILSSFLFSSLSYIFPCILLYETLIDATGEIGFSSLTRFRTTTWSLVFDTWLFSMF